MNSMQHTFIVFGAEHYNPLGVIRSLGEAGIKSVAIIIREKSCLTSKSKYLENVYYVENHKQGLQILLENYKSTENKAFLYACDDTTESFFDANYDTLINGFYFFNAGKQGRITEYMNKKNIGDLAVKYGLRFLHSKIVKKGEVLPDIEYPVITKAVDSTAANWKKNMFICYNEGDLEEAYKHISSNYIMIQKYIVKENEYCLEGFSCNKGKDVFISIESTYNYKLPLSYSPYMTVNNFSNRDNVLDPLKKMFAEIGFEGIFEVEFLISDTGALYFGEINFRNSTWSYASTCAGMNLPLLWAKSMLAGHQVKNCYVEIPKPGFKAMVELTDFKERVLKQGYSPLKWLRELKACKCRYYLGRNDIKPFVVMALSRLFKGSF